MLWRILLCLLNLIPTSFGFAAWLKCNRRLEEDEIIMNNKVRAHAEEDNNIIVKLAVYDDETGSRVDVPSDSGDAIVWIEADSSPSSLFYTIKMDPETVKEMVDLQYVIETAPFEDLKDSKNPKPSHHSRPSPTPMTPTISSPTPDSKAKSSFVNASSGGGILCNGRRAHARGKRGAVKYELARKPKQYDDGKETSLLAEVVAGFSEYHGAVTLTPCVLFIRKEKQQSKPSQGEL